MNAVGRGVHLIAPKRYLVFHEEVCRMPISDQARYGEGKRLSAASTASNLATICGVTT